MTKCRVCSACCCWLGNSVHFSDHLIGKQHLQQYSDYTYAKPPHVYPTVLGLKNYRLGFRVFPLFFHGVFRAFGFEFKVRGF